MTGWLPHLGDEPLFLHERFLNVFMNASLKKDIQHFYVAGINYKKTDATVRSLFAVDLEKYAAILSAAKEKDLGELFILSTCNRTEIYGFASSPDQLIEALCSNTLGDINLFKKIAYIKQGTAAAEHLFNVGAGLDSQLLGDYEIIGQIKKAAKFAKQYNFLGAFTERLVNSVIQVSKLIKNKTQLSTGTVSVSFAAVQWLNRSVKDITHKKILLFGIGKIGRSTCKNLVDYLSPSSITLINRTDEVAADFAQEHHLHYAPYASLAKEIQQADIILVATNAAAPTILLEHVQHSSPKIIIDLSIPQNVAPEILSLPHIRVMNVDELSKLKDETLQKREEEIPKAKIIIADYLQEFIEWAHMRKHAATLQAVKIKLQEIHAREIYNQKKETDFRPEDFEMISSRIIQKMINMMACKVKNGQQKSDQYVALINDLFETGLK